MGMSTEAPCRHRGAALEGGNFECFHPQLLLPEGSNTETCRVCREAGIFFDAEPIEVEHTIKRSKDYSLWSRPWNLLKSLRDFTKDGCRTLSVDDYKRRLDVCTACPQRERNKCGICGCYLSLKARGRAFRCPLDKWPAPESSP